MEKKNLSFEDSFKRLEEILKLLNDGEVNLEDSLKLFEEADSLIVCAQSKLQNAEQKIEKLIKNRENLLELDSDGLPKREPLKEREENILK